MNEEFITNIKSFGLTPKNNSLYTTAFTHRSYLNESREAVESNERLEFLGDSILSFIISSYIFNLRREDAEGDLTNLRSYIIKTDSLAKAATELKLGSYLRMSRGEESSGGRENTQLLANTYEAVLGAVFMDLGLEGASSFVHKTLIPLFAKEIAQGAPKDSKSQLQEVVQNKTKTSPKYKVIKTSGPDHAKKFTVGVFVSGEVVGEGVGSNKQQAEEEAAKEALIRLAKVAT